MFIVTYSYVADMLLLLTAVAKKSVSFGITCLVFNRCNEGIYRFHHQGKNEQSKKQARRRQQIQFGLFFDSDMKAIRSP
jgi:hypothetical protein